MLAATTRIRSLVYADIQRVVERQWVGGEADGATELKDKHLCAANGSQLVGGLVEE